MTKPRIKKQLLGLIPNTIFDSPVYQAYRRGGNSHNTTLFKMHYEGYRIEEVLRMTNPLLQRIRLPK